MSVSAADDPAMSEQKACPECGSESLVASGVFEHGTWILRLTCWTCKDCRSIVAIPEEPVRVAGDLTGDPA
jgi:ribosomal protein S27AE